MPERLIYGYMDPRSGFLRYVGKSTSGMRRPRQFGSHSDRCLNWIRLLAEKGLRPDIAILEELPSTATLEEINEAERRCIAYARTCLGADLTNLTEGGDGPMLGRKHSVETKTRMSAVRRGRPGVKSFLGREHTPEARAKISAANQGHSVSAEARAKMSAAKRGKPQSADHVKKRIEKIRGRKQSAEHIANRVASRLSNRKGDK